MKNNIKKLLIITFIFTFFFSIAKISLAANVWKNIFYNGQPGSSIASSYNGSVLLYAEGVEYPMRGGGYEGESSPYGHIIVSLDSGENWEMISSLPSKDWSTVKVSNDGSKMIIVARDHIYNGTILSGTGDYIYTSSDFGETWTKRTNAGQKFWMNAAISGDGNTILAIESPRENPMGEDEGYLLLSKDFGETWNKLTNAGQRAWGIAAMSQDGSKMVVTDYFGEYGEGGYIYYSDDGGDTWNPLLEAGNKEWAYIAISGDGSKIVASDSEWQRGLYSSSDFGETWEKYTNLDSNYSYGYYNSIAISNSGNDILVSSSGGELHSSSDFGETWILENEEGLYIPSWIKDIAISGDGNNVFVLTQYDGLYSKVPAKVYKGLVLLVNPKTAVLIGYADGLHEKRGVEYCLTGDSKNPCNENSLIKIEDSEVGPFYEDEFYIVLNDLTPNSYIHYRFYIEDDEDIKYTPLTTSKLTFTEFESVGESSATNVSGDGKSIIGLFYGEIIKIVDFMEPEWLSDNPFYYSNSNNYYTINSDHHMVSSSNLQKIALIAESQYVQISQDGGRTWTEQEFLGGRFWSSIAMSRDGNKIFVTDKSGNDWSGGYIYTSFDSGETWAERKGAGRAFWTSIAVSADGARLILASDNDDNWEGGSIFLSENSGITWNKVESLENNMWSSVASSANGKVLMATSYPNFQERGSFSQFGNYGAYISIDYGETWEKVDIPEFIYLNHVAISPNAEKIFLFGDDITIFSEDLGKSWIGIEGLQSRIINTSFSDDGKTFLASNNNQESYIVLPFSVKSASFEKDLSNSVGIAGVVLGSHINRGIEYCISENPEPCLVFPSKIEEKASDYSEDYFSTDDLHFVLENLPIDSFLHYRLYAENDIEKVYSETNTAFLGKNKWTKTNSGSNDAGNFDISGDGSTLLKFGGDHYLSISRDLGETWTGKVFLESENQEYIGMSKDGSKIIFIDYQINGENYHPYLKISNDYGETWNTLDYEEFVMNWLESVGVSPDTDFSHMQEEELEEYFLNLFIKTKPEKELWPFFFEWLEIRGVSDDFSVMIRGRFNDYLFVSNNGGQTWIQKTELGQRERSVIDMSSDGATILAASPHDDVLISYDYGNTWKRESSLGSQEWFNASVSANGKTMFVESRRDLYASFDSGNTWEYVNPGWEFPVSIKPKVSDDGTRAIVVGQEFRQDPGDPWASGDRYIYLYEDLSPEAKNINISYESLEAGSLLTGSYTYIDKEGDREFGTTFGWYRDGVAIIGANQNTYKLGSEDLGKTITFEIIPRAYNSSNLEKIYKSDGLDIPKPAEKPIEKPSTGGGGVLPLPPAIVFPSAPEIVFVPDTGDAENTNLPETNENTNENNTIEENNNTSSGNTNTVLPPGSGININSNAGSSVGTNYSPAPSGYFMSPNPEEPRIIYTCDSLISNLQAGSLDNDPNIVKLIQAFLNKEVDANLPITGYFGSMTAEATKAFQVKYASQVLNPWGLSNPTGNFYQSSLAKAKSLLGCHGSIVLDNGIILNY